MKKLFTILAIIASILAVILSVLPVSNLAIVPAIAALLFGLIAFYLSKKSGEVKKIIQFSFLLTIMALAITIYKAVFTETEVANTEVLEATEIKLEEASIEELEGLDFEEIDIQDTDLEDISIE
jgi:predicted membrane protein